MEEKIFECDMHCHTTLSDGKDSPQELIANAARRGCLVMAICDHDVVCPEKIYVDGNQVDVIAYGEGKGLKVIRSIEVSCETYIPDVHVVLYGCDFTNPAFADLERSVSEEKMNSYQKLMEALTKDGYPLSAEELLDAKGYVIPKENWQKKYIFELMAKKGYMGSWKEAKVFVNEKYDIQREKPSAKEIILLAHKTGGIAILAHPFLIPDEVIFDEKSLSRFDYMDLLIEFGLDGMETLYTYDKTSYIGSLSKMEIKHMLEERYSGKGLIFSGGSDYHADYKLPPGSAIREIGECGITLDYLKANEKLASLISF